MASLLLEQLSLLRSDEPGILVYPPHRSTSDPALFLLYEHYADEAAFERRVHTAQLDVFRQRVAEQGLAAGAADDAIEVELYRTI